MLVRDLINDTVPPLKTTDTVGRALAWMVAFKHTQLPVIGSNGYVGLVREEELARIEKDSLLLEDLQTPFIRVYVNEYQHILDAVRLAASHDTSVVPVLDDPGRYLGLITTSDILNAIARSNSLEEPGGVLVLDVDMDKYMLSEMARLVEAEGAKVLSASVNPSTESGKLEVTLRIDRVDLTRIMAGFFRHDYDVKASYHQSEFQPDLQARYDAFMNYLKM
ncbi:MAG: CBS domain-containing protein [Bacteroidota bacterium]|jgi:acetoin utilization protein AcuB